MKTREYLQQPVLSLKETFALSSATFMVLCACRIQALMRSKHTSKEANLSPTYLLGLPCSVEESNQQFSQPADWLVPGHHVVWQGKQPLPEDSGSATRSRLERSHWQAGRCSELVMAASKSQQLPRAAMPVHIVPCMQVACHSLSSARVKRSFPFSKSQHLKIQPLNISTGHDHVIYLDAQQCSRRGGGGGGHL